MWSKLWRGNANKKDDKGCIYLPRHVKFKKHVTVGGVNADYNTLKECFSNSLPYTTVFINPGVYDEQARINIGYPVEIVGRGDPASVVINVAMDFESDTGRLMNVTLKAPWFHECALEIRGGYMQVENCIFESSSIHVYGSGSCAFRYCHFYRSPLSFFYLGIGWVEYCVFSDVKATEGPGSLVLPQYPMCVWRHRRLLEAAAAMERDRHGRASQGHGWHSQHTPSVHKSGSLRRGTLTTKEQAAAYRSKIGAVTHYELFHLQHQQTAQERVYQHHQQNLQPTPGQGDTGIAAPPPPRGIGGDGELEERSSSHAVTITNSGRVSHSSILKMLHELRGDVLTKLLESEKRDYFSTSGPASTFFSSQCNARSCTSDKLSHSNSSDVWCQASTSPSTNQSGTNSKFGSHYTTINDHGLMTPAQLPLCNNRLTEPTNSNGPHAYATSSSSCTSSPSTTDGTVQCELCKQNVTARPYNESCCHKCHENHENLTSTHPLREASANCVSYKLSPSHLDYGCVPLEHVLAKHPNVSELFYRLRGPVFYRCKFDGVYSAMYVSHNGNVSIIQSEFVQVVHAVKLVKKAKIVAVANLFHGLQGWVFNLKAQIQGIIAGNEFRHLNDNVALCRLKSSPYFICNYVHHTKKAGILVVGKSKPKIFHNFFHHLIGPAICSLYSGDPYARLNRIQDCAHSGICIFDNGRGYIRENVICNCQLGVLVSGDSAPALIDNWIYNNDLGGIGITENGGGLYANNYIHGNKGAGIKLVNAHYLRLHGNHITNNHDHGIYLSNAQPSELHELNQNTRRILDLLHNRFCFRDPMSSEDSDSDDNQPYGSDSLCLFRNHEWKHSRVENNCIAHNVGCGVLSDTNHAIELLSNVISCNSHHGVCLHCPGISGALFPPPKLLRDPNGFRTIRSISLIDMGANAPFVSSDAFGTYAEDDCGIGYELVQDLRRVTMARLLHNKICSNGASGVWCQLSSYSRGRMEMKGNGVYNNMAHGVHTDLQMDIVQNDIFSNRLAAICAMPKSKMNIVENRLHSCMGKIFLFTSGESLLTTQNNTFFTNTIHEEIFNLVKCEQIMTGSGQLIDESVVTPWEKPLAYETDFPTNFVLMLQEAGISVHSASYPLSSMQAPQPITCKCEVPLWFPRAPPARPTVIIPPLFTDWSQRYEKNSTLSKACCLL